LITIKAKQIDGHLVLIVSDNGRGLGEDFDPAATGRLGMTIITAIVRQLRGTLEAETAGGARFVLKAPMT
jgi:two-component sensor histidine kinase